MEKLPPSFPPPLKLEDQGRFALGFFFQRAQYLAHRPQQSDNIEFTETFDTTNDDNDTTSTDTGE